MLKNSRLINKPCGTYLFIFALSRKDPSRIIEDNLWAFNSACIQPAFTCSELTVETPEQGV